MISGDKGIYQRLSEPEALADVMAAINSPGLNSSWGIQ